MNNNSKFEKPISKTIKVDGKTIKVDLINGVKSKDIPTELTGSNGKVKCVIDKVLA